MYFKYHEYVRDVIMSLHVGESRKVSTDGRSVAAFRRALPTDIPCSVSGREPIVTVFRYSDMADDEYKEHVKLQLMMGESAVKPHKKAGTLVYDAARELGIPVMLDKSSWTVAVMESPEPPRTQVPDTSELKYFNVDEML